MQTTIKFSLYDSDGNVESFLRKTFNLSRNRLKKASLSKKLLDSAAEIGREIEVPLDLVNHHEISPVYTGPDVKILKETKEFLILEKPARSHCHPLRYTDSENCLSYLRSIDRGDLEINYPNYDRGLLYRLDYETSGLLIYVNRQGLYEHCRENFQNVAIEKVYKAKVKGRCDLNGSFQHYFSAQGEKGHKRLITDEETNETGVLEITASVYSEGEDESLLTISLKSGLRHQIRAQLAELGFPIIGDELYGGESAERLYLHAELYTLDIHGDIQTYGCPCPF